MSSLNALANFGDNTGTGGYWRATTRARPVTFAITTRTETPSPTHLGPVWIFVSPTGTLIRQQSAEQEITAALDYVGFVASSLQASQKADDIGDALVRRALGTRATKPLPTTSAE